MTNQDQLSINTIRVLSAEAVQKANSGHPGLPMGAAPMSYVLWDRHLKHNPKNTKWVDRDRFVLSAGHGSMLLYSLLHVFGYDVTIDDLQDFRQLGSKTPGHPEYGHTPGVETTTGPLGQGFANAVGMAMAEAHLAKTFNRDGHNIVDHYTYALAGDGCMMEGLTSEAASLAGMQKLGKLIVFYDSNRITIEGCTELAFTEDVARRFAAYDWDVQTVEDGNDLDAIDNALKKAKKVTDKPTLIEVKTAIGYGCPAKVGTASAHGEPLGDDNLEATKEYLNWPSERAFFVPETVKQKTQDSIRKGKKAEDAWQSAFESYKREYPDLADAFLRWHNQRVDESLFNDDFFKRDKPSATRSLSGEILNELSQSIPNFFGGSADLSPSTKTLMNDRESFSPDNRAGANLHFGVREHAMAAAGNGICLHGGLVAYVSTFFVFTDYMKAAMRLSALMKQPLIYVLTHDSIGVGEDGPTHQPVEHLAALRSIPNMTVFRPADAGETAAAWHAALIRKDGPTAIILTRQNIPTIDGDGKKAQYGAYAVKGYETNDPDCLLMATGSEVHVAVDAAKLLQTEGIKARVVSMPCLELFDQQETEYKNALLPPNVKARVAIEAGVSMGWHKYTGMDGDVIAIDDFGASGPAETLFEHYGLTAQAVAKRAKELL